MGQIKDLSKKKPDATLSQTKVKIINRLLEDVRKFLVDETSIKYLDLIEDENLPQYSDVAIVLSQYSAALTQFQNKYYRQNESYNMEWYIK